jgi:hypothetical protein
MPNLTFDIPGTDRQGNVTHATLVLNKTTTPVPNPDMFVGMHVTTATAADIAANPELSIYQGMTQLQTLNKIESDLKVQSGFNDTPLLRCGRAFMQPGDQYQLSGWASTQLSRYPAMVLNFKPNSGDTTAGFQAIANGTDDNRIIAMINALPQGKRVYVVVGHEPTETPGAYATAWRMAQVRVAQLILANRGTKDIHLAICLTTWSFRPNNVSTQAQFLSVKNDFAAAGIDWANAVVMGPDGYEDKATDVGGDAEETFENVWSTLVAQGWKRFGVGEFACPSKAGNLDGKTVTAADVALADEWLKSFAKMADRLNFEYANWFNATGSKGPIGSWQYTNLI